MKKFSPLVVFTHLRINELKKCISSIKKCKESKNTHLYIISDGAVDQTQEIKVNKVRKYIRSIKGFKKKTIYLRKKNFGLSKNIILGITKIINKHGRIIVLEEDIIVQKEFINFMNLSLEKYKNESKIWHISGWNYNVNISSNFDAYCIRTMNCWGWGTWKNRWINYKKNPNKIINKWSKQKISKFNFDDTLNFYSQIVRNYKKRINTWAVFWYATIFENNKLCINPTMSLTENIGIGKKATHTINVDDIFKSKFKSKSKTQFVLPTELTESRFINHKIQKKIKKNKIKKFFIKLKKLL